MLSLHDSRTGKPVRLQPARRGQLRTYLVIVPAGGPLPPTGLRSCLLADLVRRVAERHNLRVSAWQHLPEGASGQEFAAVWDALNIYPAEFAARRPEPFDVVISAGEVAGGGHWVRAASVRFNGGAEAKPGRAAVRYAAAPGSAGPGNTAPLLPELSSRGIDPLALRLAFLEHHYLEPLRLGWESLTAAHTALRRWRDQVADWARSPSRPMPATHVRDVLAAFDDDLYTPAALTALRALASDPGIPAGSKFEAFAYLDRLLGLDLAREVGR